MNNNITIEEKGARLYVLGNTFSIKSALKEAGCHWDGEEKAWWIGKGKRAELEKALGAEPEKENLLEKPLYAQVEYKDRKYYVIASGEEKARLTDFQGKLDFWVKKEECKLLKEYTPRTVGYGRYAHEQRQTLSSLHRFIEQKKAVESGGECPRCRDKQPYLGSGDYEDCSLCGATYCV